MPLAEKIRPQTLDEFVGQKHLTGENCVLRKIIENTGEANSSLQSVRLPNLIFYGPSGTGKTTLANIIASRTDMTLRKLNGTQAGTADIKQIIAETNTLYGRGWGGHSAGILLYLDEIQYLNKKQQQSLLEFIEDGSLTLIAATTENPYFYVYGAILSRSTVFEFKPVEPADIIPAIERGFRLFAEELKLELIFENKDEIFLTIARGCGGDVRKALNAVEICALTANSSGTSAPNEMSAPNICNVSIATAKEAAQKSAVKYDREGDAHYDLLSALQKSIRGSDENAALHYLARLLAAGDLPSACRRLLVTASEDIGLAFPNAVVIVKNCIDSALQLGLPEARIPLAEAVVLLCTSPKSNSAYLAIDKALADVEKGLTGDFPRHLQNKHCDGEDDFIKGQNYKYPHNFPNHYVEQQYLPDEIKDRVYYEFGDNKLEQAAREYREKVKGEL
ncbi:MAG: replication-associated recombination protein A [Oscillospiraceae bacterium]|nr:replication-associated recombination protein A [Oscillospiraceae bacterium]